MQIASRLDKKNSGQNGSTKTTRSFCPRLLRRSRSVVCLFVFVCLFVCLVSLLFLFRLDALLFGGW